MLKLFARSLFKGKLLLINFCNKSKVRWELWYSTKFIAFGSYRVDSYSITE